MKSSAVLLGIILSLVASSPAVADSIDISPSQAAVRTNGEGATEIYLNFDLSNMRQADEFRVYDAVLDWTLNSLDAGASFLVYEVTEGWSVAAVEGSSEIDFEASAADEWDLASLDKQRLGSFVRLEITDIVTSWVESQASNHGILITTENVSEASAVQQIGSATLTIRYGCCK